MYDLAVIILNWNGWRDTCECLASLLRSPYQKFQIVLVDNGSDDDSVDRIKSWAKGEIGVAVGPFESEPEYRTVDMLDYPPDDVRGKKRKEAVQHKIVFICNPKNAGFARGCNIGIRYAMTAGFRYVLVLNNDTTVDRLCLGTLTELLDTHAEYSVATPLIYYYHHPNRIWYFGGRLTFTGRRSIYYQNSHAGKAALPAMKNVAFVSGCAFLARVEVFKKHGLLSERFFFGEEDYEFSLRMRENRERMTAVSSAVVYHKVGEAHSQVFGQDRLPYAFIGYLNRFIDKKLRHHLLYWKFWRFLCLSYIVSKMLIWDRYSLVDVVKMRRLLITYSNIHDEVSKEMFFKAKTFFPQ